MAKRQLTEREKAERLEFVKHEVIKRFGSERGSVKRAAEALAINYAQLVNIMGGASKPTEKLLQDLGYADPEFVTPLGNKWTAGDIIEVELTENAKHARNSLINFRPWYNWRQQEAKILNRELSRIYNAVLLNPTEWLDFDIVRDKTDLEKRQIAEYKVNDISNTALAASGHESDMAGDNINSLWEGLE